MWMVPALLLILNLEVGAQVFAWFLLLYMDAGDLRARAAPAWPLTLLKEDLDLDLVPCPGQIYA